MSKGKWGAIATVVLVVALLALLMLTSGCASLFGPSMEKAREVAEAREADATKAVEAYAKAAKDLEDVVAKYEAAVASGDTTAAQALAVAVKEAIARHQSAKDVAEASRDLFKAAAEDFKNAKSSSDYVGTVFGWITAGLGALFGGGALVGRSRAREAVAGTTKALEKVKNDPGDAWPSAKADMQATLSTGALKVIEALRP